MRLNDELERMNTRCEILESYGLEINHKDSNVAINNFGIYLKFDLSATSEEWFVRDLIQQAYHQGVQNGIKDTQVAMRSLLGINDE